MPVEEKALYHLNDGQGESMNAHFLLAALKPASNTLSR